MIMRLLDLPRQMPTNVSEFVEAELSQYVALSGRRRRMDFCGVRTGGAAQRRLLAVAADAEELGDAFLTCRAARIPVTSVEPAALAYARAFLAGEREARHGDALIALLGATNLVMCLFSKGTLDFVRIRDLPVGMGSPDQMRAWLTDELNVVLQYHRTSAPSANATVQTRLVVHDAAYGKDEIAPLCLSDAKSPMVVDSYEPIGLFAGAAGGTSAAPSAVAVGAALKLLDVELDELRIDLTPHEVTRARSSSRRLLIAANAAAVMLLSVFLIAQLLTRTTDAMNRRIGQARLEGQLHTMPAMAAQDQYLDEEISRIRVQLAGMSGILAERDVDWPTILDVIAQSTPQGVCVTHLSCSDSHRLSLKGVALSYDRAKLFVENLDGREFFESVCPARMERRQIDADLMEYEIECVLKIVKEGSFRDDRSQP